jgi:hypothetical protein
LIFAPNSTQAPKQTGEIPAHGVPSGGNPMASQAPTASVTVNGATYNQVPNQLGVFPQIQIQPKGIVQVQITYPRGNPGDPIAIAVQDGGHLIVNDKSAMSQVLGLNGQNSLQFQFQATEQLGIYRISLRNGADVHVINLWAGDNLASQQ